MQTRRTLPSRREILTSIAAVGAMTVTGARGEDARWPDHPVRIIVPYPAGGSTDVLTRILAERFKDIFGQPFVIENRAGAGGRYCGSHRQFARWIHHWRRDHRPFRDQSVSLQQDALRSRTRHDPGITHLGIAQRLRRPRGSCAGKDIV